MVFPTNTKPTYFTNAGGTGDQWMAEAMPTNPNLSSENYPHLDELLQKGIAWWKQGAPAPELVDAVLAQEVEKHRQELIHENSALKAELAALKAQPDGWIAVTERLPKDETPVLILWNGLIRIGERRWEEPTHEDTYERFWYWDDPEDDGQCWENMDVTYWSPLPTPPVREKEGRKGIGGENG